MLFSIYFVYSGKYLQGVPIFSFMLKNIYFALFCLFEPFPFLPFRSVVFVCSATELNVVERSSGYTLSLVLLHSLFSVLVAVASAEMLCCHCYRYLTFTYEQCSHNQNYGTILKYVFPAFQQDTLRLLFTPLHLVCVVGRKAGGGGGGPDHKYVKLVFCYWYSLN